MERDQFYESMIELMERLVKLEETKTEALQTMVTALDKLDTRVVELIDSNQVRNG